MRYFEIVQRILQIVQIDKLRATAVQSGGRLMGCEVYERHNCSIFT